MKKSFYFTLLKIPLILASLLLASSSFADTSFLANTLTLATRNFGPQAFEDAMKITAAESGDGLILTEGVWASSLGNWMNLPKGTEGNYFTARSITDTVGITLFADRFTRNWSAAYVGAYISRIDAVFEQARDNGEALAIGGGIYGGVFGDALSVFGNIGASNWIIDTERQNEIGLESDADIVAHGYEANVELDYRLNNFDLLTVKPFAGLNSAFVHNDSFAEREGSTNYEIDRNDYVRLSGLAGVKLEDEIGKFKWGARVYIGSLLYGIQEKYYTSANDIIYTTRESTLLLGQGFNASYTPSKSFSMSIRVNHEMSDLEAHSFSAKFQATIFFGAEKRYVWFVKRDAYEVAMDILSDEPPKGFSFDETSFKPLSVTYHEDEDVYMMDKGANVAYEVNENGIQGRVIVNEESEHIEDMQTKTDSAATRESILNRVKASLVEMQAGYKEAEEKAKAQKREEEKAQKEQMIKMREQKRLDSIKEKQERKERRRIEKQERLKQEQMDYERQKRIELAMKEEKERQKRRKKEEEQERERAARQIDTNIRLVLERKAQEDKELTQQMQTSSSTAVQTNGNTTNTTNTTEAQNDFYNELLNVSDDALK